ncbi:MAG: alkaline phosphatase family protein [Gemmatimonadaceae bacterium]|nr:alkaline phosphatase family protein [Gemmatimonadaceae bacterium]MCW5827613.1 alkaline phosphatase family protein [Gemmatimonadaceae bacterium]
MPLRRWITALALLSAAGLGACRRADHTALPPGAVASTLPATTPRVVMISLDGFRYDYINRPNARRLRALAASGVRAERLVPSFPSKTFPNHYTLVTGLRPEQHGIVANHFRDPELGFFTLRDTIAQSDPRWWGGEPIWVAAERQGLRAAIVGWPGSEAPIGGRHATWWSRYDHELPRDVKVRRILDWLSIPASRAPSLILGYFHEVDGAGHSYGPDSPQVDAAIAQVDSALGALIDGIARRGMADKVVLVIVSDHGMTATSPQRLILLDDYIALEDVDVVDWAPVTQIEPKPGAEERVYAALQRAHPALAVYRKGEVPVRYHFNANPRITKLVAVAEDGWTIASRAQAQRWREQGWRGGGNHGYAPEVQAMGATFVVAGAGIPRGRVIPAFGNVHVVAVLGRLLGVSLGGSEARVDSVRLVFP